MLVKFEFKMIYTASEVVLVIAALGAVIVNVVTALKVSSKLTTVSERAAVIEGHVNSERSKMSEQLLSRQKEIDFLRSTLADKDKTAALLAQSILKKNEN